MLFDKFPKKQISLNSLLLKLASYCAYQERCLLDVKKQLDKYDLTEEQREQAITYLYKEKYLNDLRFAQSFTRGKFQFKSWGKNKIQAHLKSKGISEVEISKALKEINPLAYKEKCFLLLERKLESLEKKEESIAIKKQKAINSLMQKGYGFDIIQSCLKEFDY